MCIRRLTLMAWAGVLSTTASTWSAEQDAAGKVLKDHGLTSKKILSAEVYVLQGELDVHKRLDTIKRDKAWKRLVRDTRELRDAEVGLVRMESDAAGMTAELDRIREQMKYESDRGRAYPYNRLVGQHNDLVSRLNNLRREYGLAVGRVNGLRASAAGGRAEYLQSLLDLRVLVNETLEQYEKLGKDQDVKSALAAVNRSRQGTKPVVLGPSRRFSRDVKRLVELEKPLRAEIIALRPKGGVMWVEAVVNGKTPVAMLLDTGATYVSLPRSLAAKCGAKATAADPEKTLRLANGTTSSVRITRLESLRVGGFEVANLECAVPTVEGAAPPLLGQSFLRHFTYTVDPHTRKLTLRKLEVPTEDAKPSKKGKRRSRRR